jgi:ethanolamine utilization cobalamin adenosyltransferase
MDEMTPELEKYYTDRFEMMSTEGWKDLIEDIDKIIATLNNISVIDSEKDLQFKKGELSILSWLKNLKEISERAYEEIL